MPKPSRLSAALAIYAAVILVGLAIALRGVPGVLASDVRDRVPPRSAVPANGTTTIELPQGSNAEQIVEQLEKAGVVRDGKALRALLDFAGLSSKLQAGRYRFTADLPPAEIARLLAGGPNRPQVITLREGLRNEEIGDALQKEGVVSPADWDAALTTPRQAVFLESRPAGMSLLGYLLPATYAFDEKTTGNSMVQSMLDAFGKQVTPEMIAAGKNRGMTLHQVITLASIVEREAANAGERPLIAAVFINRLTQNVPLQADPTVQFAVSRVPGNVEKFGYWKKNLQDADLALNSPYNTYLNRGLPPGPIANPGIDSIKAVVNPAPVNYLYFVASPACDGTHQFAATLAQHNANVAQFNASQCAKGN
ncbi:MAG: endolytic transglycosylase MltG [Chloroflexota bacterium]